MENLMFWGMFIACLLISAMTFYILNLQKMVNIIKKALEVQKLEELQKRKELVEREIKKLEI